MIDSGTDGGAPAAPGGAERILQERFGHEGFLPGQDAVVRSAAAGRNLLVVMPTGSGKSLLYQLPALMADGITLVVSPLIALMKDQVDELVRRRIPAALINSSLSLDRQRETIRQCIAGEVRLLYVAPERFRSMAFTDMLGRVRIARVAVDEAHCISEWGHDFRPDYRRLKAFRRQMGDPVVTALTATATPRVQKDIVQALGLDPDQVEVHVHGFDRPNLALSVVHARGEADKNRALCDFVGEQDGSGIVYVGTRKAAEKIADILREIEPRTTMYHAGMDAEQRSSAQEAFLTGKARLAVATVAFGMGIDKAAVRFVVHYHYPGSVEQYYQEIGRAGRDGKPSRCVLLYSPGDRFLREFFIELSYPTRTQVAGVMAALYRLADNPVMLTYKQIADLCDEPVKDGQVGSALRLLEGAGITQPLAGGAAAQVSLHRPGAEILAGIRGQIQRRVFEALAATIDLETPGHYDVNLDQLAQAAQLSAGQVQRALTAVGKGGQLDYEPPFRGRGVRKLLDSPPPFDQAAIDWDRQDFLRSIEADKLTAMETFIHHRQCRRGFILSYFGESRDLVCGTCDTCLAGQHRPAPAGSVLSRLPDVAGAVLVCIRTLRFPLGADRTAKVVTGSQDSKLRQWGLDRNPAYGKAMATQKLVRQVIDELIAEGLVCHQRQSDRPVLALTAEGRAAADEIDLDRLTDRPVAPPAAVATEVGVAAAAGRPATDSAIRQAALQCVELLPFSVGVGRVAEVLTGSKAKWIASAGADDLAVYASTSARQADVRQVIRDMIAEGLLAQNVKGRYPVLELADAGREHLPEAQEPEPAEPAPEPVAPQVDRPADTPSPQRADSLERLVDEILTAGRDEASALLDSLGRYHPRRVAAGLSAAYAADGGPRQQARAIWAAGQLCGQYGLELLLQAANAESDPLRRLAAIALAKVASQLCDQARGVNQAMTEIHESLQQLMQDPSAEVCQAAEESIRRLVGP